MMDGLDEVNQLGTTKVKERSVVRIEQRLQSKASGRVHCRKRLGVLLKYYHLRAA
jgi:hypothetical protein